MEISEFSRGISSVLLNSTPIYRGGTTLDKSAGTVSTV